jgi:hypothetical protein
MKKFLTPLFLFIGSAVLAQQPAPVPTPVIHSDAGIFQFNEMTHDFGEVPEGPAVNTDFVFKNVGKSPIVITNIDGGCSCVHITWPKQAVLPSESGTIHVTYDTKGRVGGISNNITIYASTQNNITHLAIRGLVVNK